MFITMLTSAFTCAAVPAAPMYFREALMTPASDERAQRPPFYRRSSNRVSPLRACGMELAMQTSSECAPRSSHNRSTINVHRRCNGRRVQEDLPGGVWREQRITIRREDTVHRRIVRNDGDDGVRKFSHARE